MSVYECENCGKPTDSLDRCPLCEAIADGRWKGNPLCEVGLVCTSCARAIRRNLASDPRVVHPVRGVSEVHDG